MRLRTGLLAVSMTTAALYACQALIGIEDDPGLARLPDAPPPFDAGPDADPCPHARPPPKPDGGASDPESTVQFAVRKVFLGGLRDFPTAYDFDGICSCENRDERIPGLPRTSCVQATEACAPGASTDDPEGRDLGGLNALAAARSFLPLIEPDINKPFEQGRLGFLVRVQGYNETANDTLVQVRVSTSIGIEARADGGSRTGAAACADAATNIVPSWNGAGDRWFGPNNGGAASEGYVTNGTLVVNGSTASYEIPVGAQVLRQSKSVFVASIFKPDGGAGLKLRGNLVGLVSANNLLSVIGEFPDFTFFQPGDKPRICESDGGGALALFKSPLCAARDLLENSNDPTRACDALAFVVGIEAEQVVVENLAPCGPFAGAGAPCNLKCDPSDPSDAGSDSGDGGRRSDSGDGGRD